MSRTFLKLIFYGLLILNLGYIVMVWWVNVGVDETGWLLATGRLAGLLAVFAALMQLVLMGRGAWLEGVFGLDKLAKVHKWNGYATMILILTHAFAIINAYAMAGEISILEQVPLFVTQYDDMFKAIMAEALFVVVVVSSITIVKKKLRYEWWYGVHLLTYLAIVLAFGHQVKYGGDFALNQGFITYWYGLYAFVFGNLICYRSLLPIYQSIKFGFMVKEVRELNESVNQIVISGKSINKFGVKPGQYVIIRFLNKELWWQPHPFTISHPPKGNEMRLTIKKLGDFTSQLQNVRRETKMLIEGPYGVFTKEAANKKKWLMLAGGIGITPIRAMVEQIVSDSSYDVVLINNNKLKKDVVFGEDLEDWGRRQSVKVFNLFSAEGEQQKYMTKEDLLVMCPDVVNRDVFLCGPPPMMRMVLRMLSELGVPNDRVHFEQFAL